MARMAKQLSRLHAPCAHQEQIDVAVRTREPPGAGTEKHNAVRRKRTHESLNHLRRNDRGTVSRNWHVGPAEWI